MLYTSRLLDELGEVMREYLNGWQTIMSSHFENTELHVAASVRQGPLNCRIKLNKCEFTITQYTITKYNKSK
jgi:hypothetical protein